MRNVRSSVLVAACGFLGGIADAAVTGEDAKRLATTLTPFGAERAGNADGTIPPWAGGHTAGGADAAAKRTDPFAGDKPLYSINAKNMDQYAAKLSEGTRALMQKYPDFRIDVYPTRRTAAAPQWVYDNTLRNATRARLVDSSGGPIPEGAYGGIPFPIPQSGTEAIWNHVLHWRAPSWSYSGRWYLVTADGKHVLTSDTAPAHLQMPYYLPDGSPEKFGGDYWLLRGTYTGPPIRNGEALIARLNVNDDKSQLWVYLPGQRRVRKLPNPCCDTPAPAASGVMAIDEIGVFTGRTSRFDWKIVGKKELFIPYNANRFFHVSDAEAMKRHFINPDVMRWELHRVWVLEATLRPGERHQAHKAVYYLDEDTWIATLADRWDAKGQLWKTLWSAPVVVAESPATMQLPFGYYDLLSNTWFAAGLVGLTNDQSIARAPRPDTFFTPEAMAGEGIR